MLCCLALMDQAAVLDGLCFDLLPFCEDCGAAPEVDVLDLSRFSGECPIFCVTGIWSMLPERSKDYDHFQGKHSPKTIGVPY